MHTTNNKKNGGSSSSYPFGVGVAAVLSSAPVHALFLSQLDFFPVGGIAVAKNMSRLFFFVALLAAVSAFAFGLSQRATVMTTSCRLAQVKSPSTKLQMAVRPQDPRDPRRIIGKDNLGEPIYEGDENTGETLNVLGAKFAVDPLSAGLVIFGLIAFQFFVVANL